MNESTQPVTSELDCDPAALAAIERRLAVPPTMDVAALSGMTRQRLQPVLAEIRSRRWQQHVGVGLVVALAPLPFVLAWGTLLARWLLVVATAVLPTPLVHYAVGSYAAAVVLLIGLTYASIPLLLSGRIDPQRRPPQWNYR